MNESYAWLIWSTYENNLTEMSSLNFGLNSDVKFATPGVFLTDLYKVDYSTSLITRPAAQWHPTTGFKFKTHGTHVNLRSNFHGFQFKGNVVVSFI